MKLSRFVVPLIAILIAAFPAQAAPPVMSTLGEVIRWMHPSTVLPVFCIKPSGKICAQSLELTDHGDPVDINIMNIGGAQGGAFEPTKPHTRLFQIAGQSWSNPMPASYHANAMYSQRQGACTVSATSRCGYHEFRTTRAGNLLPRSGNLGGVQLEIHPQNLSVPGDLGFRVFPSLGNGVGTRENNTFVVARPCPGLAGFLCLMIPAN